MPLRHQTLILFQTLECLTSPSSWLRQCQRYKNPAPDLNHSSNLSFQPSLQRRHLGRLFSKNVPSRTTRPTRPANSSCPFLLRAPHADPYPHLLRPLPPASLPSHQSVHSSPPPHHLPNFPLLPTYFSFGVGIPSMICMLSRESFLLFKNTRGCTFAPCASSKTRSTAVRMLPSIMRSYWTRLWSVPFLPHQERSHGAPTPSLCPSFAHSAPSVTAIPLHVTNIATHLLHVRLILASVLLIMTIPVPTEFHVMF